MPELDPLSTQLPTVSRQVALHEVYGPGMLPQEHILLNAYPSLRNDLLAAAKTVAPDAKEVLMKLSSAFFSQAPPGANSSHLDFWRAPDQGAKPWNVATNVEELYPSIRGTLLAEECEEILQRAIGKVEEHLRDMRATLSGSLPGAEEGADEAPETDKSGEPDISAKFHFRRDFFLQLKAVQTVLQFDVIFDSKCTPFVPGCSYASFGFVFQSAITVGNVMDERSYEKARHQLTQVVYSQIHRSSSTSHQKDLPDIYSSKFTVTPSVVLTGAGHSSAAASMASSVHTAQTAGMMGPPPGSMAFSGVTDSIPASLVSFGCVSHDDSQAPGR
jgi:hypothetical protein